VKAGTAGLAAWLATARTAVCADLYTITLQSGTVLRYTSCDRHVIFGAETWLSDGPVIRRGRVRITMGADVGTLEVTIAPKQGQVLESLPWMEAIRRGVLDNAQVLLQRSFAPSWGAAIVGLSHKFYGRVASIECTRAIAEIEVRSPLELLDTQVPAERFQPQCRNTLFDAACGLSGLSYEISRTVASGSTQSVLNFSQPQAAGYYSLGRVQFISGPNAGAYRSVKVHNTGQLELVRPLHAMPSVGDVFLLRPGCDRVQATCSGKFGNLARFRGEPYIPRPEVQQ
jgi:uncharacterized phage protein (TIGR02218 family)